MFWPLLLLTSLDGVRGATTLYGGAQNVVLPANLSSSCLAAFNTSLDCPANVQLLTYGNQAVAWNTSSLTLLCTPACNSSLVTLQQAVTSGCAGQSLQLASQNYSYPTLIDLFQYKWSLACLTSSETGAFCSDVEASWNITTMVANKAATWPTSTNKTYYDISQGSWDPYVDENGTLADPFSDDIWVKAADVNISPNQMTGLDYYVQRLPPSDNTNFGWPTILSADEYPLEIQCSSCFQQRYIHGLESTWGDIWDIMSSQVWANMQSNCNLTTNINPAYNLTLPPIDLALPPANMSACPNPLTVSNTTCAAIALDYSVPLASLPALNYFSCSNVNGVICAGLSCPVAVNPVTQSVRPFVSKYTNFTLTQFLSWNRYINPAEILANEVVCVGPPGGPYSPPAVTLTSTTISTTSTTTSIASTTTPANGISTPTPYQTGMATNCNKFHLVVSGDQCGTIASNAGITLANFYAWNPAVGSTCAYLDLRDYVCIGTLTCTSASVLAAPVQYASTCGPPGFSHDSPTSLLIASYTSGPSITSAAACGAQCIATAGCTNIYFHPGSQCNLHQGTSTFQQSTAAGYWYWYDVSCFSSGEACGSYGFSHDTTSTLIISYTSGSPYIASAAACGAKCLSTSTCTNVYFIQGSTCNLHSGPSSYAWSTAAGYWSWYPLDCFTCTVSS